MKIVETITIIRIREIVGDEYFDDPIITPVPVKLPHMPIAQCTKCGIDIYQVMGYYCMHNYCPIFPKAIS